MAADPSSVFSTHDLDEIRRSAEEARDYSFVPTPEAQIRRYLNPPANSIYPLEYAFHLLGDISQKTVVDLGCGKGENLVPLAKRGGHVVGVDLSPDLVALAKRRVEAAGVKAEVRVGSAYATGLPDESKD